MSGFFQKRLSRHQKKMSRYLRFVFNDHFTLICTFLLGGLGLYYSDSLKTLPQPFWQGKLLVIFVLLFSLSIGKLATLIEPADVIFLLPKELELMPYLKKAFSYSLLLPFGVLFLITGAAMPLIAVSTGQSFVAFFFYLLVMWSLKTTNLMLQGLALYQNSASLKKQLSLLWWVLSIFCLFLSVFLQPFLGMLAALVQLGLFTVLCKRNNGLLDWEKMVKSEQARQNRIYRFINLFTDVPQITATAKRRKYFDVFLNKISFRHENTYLYLFARRLLRGAEFSGLYLRLLFLGGFVLAFVDDRLLGLILGCLFLYLIGFQLVPIYNDFQYMVLIHLYPVDEAQKIRAVQKLLTILLLVAAGIFSIMSLVSMPQFSDTLILAVGYLFFVWVFMYFYVPKRLSKMTEQH